MKKIISVLVIVCLVAVLSFSLNFQNKTAQAAIVSDIDYSESLNVLTNPDRGFYYFCELFVKDSSQTTATVDFFKQYLNGQVSGFPKGTGVIKISFGLEYYSAKMGGTDMDITANGLQFIRQTLQNAKTAGVTLVLRFRYYLKGTTYSDNYTSDSEPSMDQLLRHVRQISGVVSDFTDVITVLETGMFGPWGEQHGSTFSKYTNKQSYYSLIEEWMNNTPDDLWLAVRRPYLFLHWYNTKFSTNYTADNMDTLVLTAGTKAARICVYNDGYLTDATDWDTYKNREKEIAFLSQHKFAPYGGEVCSPVNGLSTYNKISYLEVEAFKTHTAYLNYQWDYQKVIRHWEAETYNGKDNVYKGKTSSFVYVLNHLGYRLVLKESSFVPSTPKGEVVTLSGKIENVGFGNITRRQKVEIVFANSSGNEVFAVESNIDAQSFLSTKIIDYSTQITIPTNLDNGNYKIYLRFFGEKQTADGKRFIQFANNNIYNDTIKGNYIGTITLTDQVNSSAQQSSASTNSETPKSVENSKSISSSTSSSDKTQSSISEQKGCKSQIEAKNSLLFVLPLLGLTALVLKRNKTKTR